MFERFTPRARKVMALANQEAQRLNHEWIGSEHILLGLVKEGCGVGANVLRNLDVDRRRVQLELEKLVKPADHGVLGDERPQTPRAQQIVRDAEEESRRLNHDHLGTEHLLLGLLREQDGVAAQVLMKLGLTLDDVRQEVFHLVTDSDAATIQNDLPEGSYFTYQHEQRPGETICFGDMIEVTITEIVGDKVRLSIRVARDCPERPEAKH